MFSAVISSHFVGGVLTGSAPQINTFGIWHSFDKQIRAGGIRSSLRRPTFLPRPSRNTWCFRIQLQFLQLFSFQSASEQQKFLQGQFLKLQFRESTVERALSFMNQM